MVGNALAFQRDPLQFFRVLARYGSISSFRLGPIPANFLTEPTDVRQVLVEQAECFSNREVYRLLVPVLGNGLIATDGDIHTEHRRLIQPAFHPQRIANYAEIMVNATLEQMNGWRTDQVINITDELIPLTMRIVGQTLFSMDLVDGAVITTALEHIFAYLDNLLGIIALKNLPLYIPGMPYYKYKVALQSLDRAIYGIIARHREMPDNGDMLSLLIRATDERGARFTDKDLRDHIMTFIIAGHETPVAALSWAFYLLSKHPDVSSKLMQRISHVVGDRPATAADLHNLLELDGLLKETLRLYPPAWQLSRYAKRDTQIGGHLIRKGTQVVFSPYLIHRHPKYWQDPDDFRPERFAHDRNPTSDSAAYMPFGAGAHKCIGMHFALMELKLILVTILQRFNPQVVTPEPIGMHPSQTLRVRGGLQVELHPRSHGA